MTFEVRSPCVGICRIHVGTGWCTGCLRSLSEIEAWPELGGEERLEILRHLPLRRDVMPPPALRKRAIDLGD